MSKITKTGIMSALDPLDILGQSSSSIMGNVTDPLDILGRNPKAGPPPPPSPNINPATGQNYAATVGTLPPNYLGANAGLPTNAGYSSPSMSGYGFNYYGGQAPLPQGGYFNQMAQAMAGPSYAPAGTSWANTMPSNSGKGGASPQAPAIGSVMTQSPFGNPLNPASLNPNFSPGVSAQSQPSAQASGGSGLNGIIRRLGLTHAF